MMRIRPALGRMTRPQRRNAPIRRTLAHTVGIGALVALLMASGAGVTFAIWTASTSATSSASGAQLSVKADFGGALNNFSFQNHVNTVTGTVTVRNTTDIDASQGPSRTTARPVSTKLGATVADPNAAKLSQFAVRAWRTTTPATCSTQAVPSGTPAAAAWGDYPALVAELAPGASVAYCVRVVAAERTNLGVANGSFTITPTATSTITVGGSSWTASAVAPPITQQTQHIYPAATALSTSNWMRISMSANRCLDVLSSSDQEGQALIGYGCKANTDSGKTNQRWRLVKDGNYYRVVSQLPQARAFMVSGSSTGSGAGVVMSSAVNDSGSWQAQVAGDNSYQLVNKASGLCLTRGADSGGISPMSQTPCAATAAQLYSFTADGFYGNPLANADLQLTCAPNGNGITLGGWGTVPQGMSYTLNVWTGTWSPLQTNITGSSVNVSANTGWNNGPIYFQVTDGTNVKEITATKGSHVNWIIYPFWGNTVHTLGCS